MCPQEGPRDTTAAAAVNPAAAIAAAPTTSQQKTQQAEGQHQQAKPRPKPQAEVQRERSPSRIHFFRRFATKVRLGECSRNCALTRSSAPLPGTSHLRCTGPTTGKCTFVSIGSTLGSLCPTFSVLELYHAVLGQVGPKAPPTAANGSTGGREGATAGAQGTAQADGNPTDGQMHVVVLLLFACYARVVLPCLRNPLWHVVCAFRVIRVLHVLILASLRRSVLRVAGCGGRQAGASGVPRTLQPTPSESETKERAGGQADPWQCGVPGKGVAGTPPPPRPE